MPDAKLTKREERAREKRMQRARDALAACSINERDIIFRQLGACSCASLAQAAAKHPTMAIGAVVGGILGAAVMAIGDKKPGSDWSPTTGWNLETFVDPTKDKKS